MLSIIKAEFKKFLTVRSTYFVTGFVLLLVAFLSTFVFGYHQAAQKASSPIFVADTLYTMLGTFVMFVTILAILLVAHEYRYNTILYSFTLTRSRLKVLLAKTLVMLTYATVAGAAVVAIAFFGSQIGLNVRNVSLAPQSISVAEVAWQFIAYVWGYALVGIVLATILRGLVASIVAFFVIPTVEGILTPLLKEDTRFLPFRALDAVPATGDPNSIASVGIKVLDNAAALGVFCVYLVVFGALAIILFVKRDAN